MGFDISYMGAVVAGLLSFFSPCILPIVPFYLCYMAGLSMHELTGQNTIAPGARRQLVISSILFSAGVLTIFVLLGLAATSFGQVFRTYMDELSYAAALLLFVFGLHFLGIVRIPILYREARIDSSGLSRASYISSYLIGLAFGFGWTPCVGPALAAILFLASQQDSLWQGGSLLFVYGAAMTFPFIIAALFSGPFLRWVAKHRRYLGVIEKIMGGFLILFAVLLATGSVNAIGQWLIETFPFFQTYT